MRVLVIEDDQETASFLRRALKESGHVAEYAGDGQQGCREKYRAMHNVVTGNDKDRRNDGDRREHIKKDRF